MKKLGKKYFKVSHIVTLTVLLSLLFVVLSEVVKSYSFSEIRNNSLTERALSLAKQYAEIMPDEPSELDKMNAGNPELYALNNRLVPDVSHVSIYNNSMDSIASFGDKWNVSVIKRQFNSKCGVFSVQSTKRACFNIVRTGAVNAYAPILDLQNNAIGIVYFELSDDAISSLLSQYNAVITVFLFSIAFLLLMLLLLRERNQRAALDKVAQALESELSEHMDSGFSITEAESSVEVMSRVKSAVCEVVSTSRQEVDSVNTRNAQLEDLMEASQEKADKFVKQNQYYLSKVSHEVRTPLHSIIGMTEHLLESDMSQEARIDLSTIHASAKQMDELVDSVLISNAMRSKQVDFPIEPVDVDREIDVIVSGIAMRYSDDKPVCVYANIAPNVPKSILIAKQPFITIVNNLANNAMKFTESGYVEVSVQFSPKTTKKGTLIIDVKDTGKGIEKSVINKIFDANSQFHNDDVGHGGVGMGLSMVSAYVNALMGSIVVTSEVNPAIGTGSNFKVQLDVEMSDEQSNVESMGQVTVVAEDHRAQHSLASKFNRQGYSVSTFKTFKDLSQASNRVSNSWLAVVSQSPEHLKQQLGSIRELEANFDKVFVFVFGDVSAFRTLLLDSKGLVVRFNTAVSSLNELSLNEPNLHQIPIVEPVSDEPIKEPAKTVATILSVDDHLPNLKLIEKQLSAQPYEIVSCDSGFRAVELCKTRKFDLILMDRSMPEMDGIETTKRIKQEGLNQDTPIIAATASISELEHKTMLEVGMQPLLKKPFTKRKLMDVLSQFLGASTAA